MIAEPTLSRPWFVIESDVRWLHATRRFADELMPSPLRAVPRRLEPGPDLVLPSGLAALAIWEVDPSNLASVCSRLATTPRAPHGQRPLHLAAVSALSNRERLVLLEFGAATLIEHPEELGRLKPMIQAYFAS